jgi:hypothetical protein
MSACSKRRKAVRLLDYIASSLMVVVLTIMLVGLSYVRFDTSEPLRPRVDVERTLASLGSEEQTKCITTTPDVVEMQSLLHLQDSWQIVSLCDVDVTEVSTAFSIFYYAWVKEFGDPDKKVLNNLNKMMVEWGEENKVVNAGYSISGVKKTNVKIAGMTVTKGYIWVKRNHWGHVYRTSLIHELVHASLWAATGSPDADHEATVYRNENYWTRKHTKFIKKVNKILSSLNI